MTEQDKYFQTGHGGLWIQPDGPNTDVLFLGCHDLGDVAKPKGDVTPKYCRDWRNGGWQIVNRIRGVPDLTTFSITTYVGKTQDWLEAHQACPMPVYVHQSMCARRDSFPTFERGQVLPFAIITNHGETNLVSREAVEASEQTFDFSSGFAHEYYIPSITRQTSVLVDNALDVAFCNVHRCMGSCGPSQNLCQVGYFVTDGPIGVGEYGEIVRTADGGATWTAVAGHPFAVGLIAALPDFVVSVVCFPVDDTTSRVLVTRDDSSGGGGALDVAYSDDNGVTWTNVIVGAAADVATGGGALFALNMHHIWMCWTNAAGNAGYISKSEDGGVTWTAQLTAGTDALNYVRFIDPDHGICVGDTEEIWLTSDGGTTWAVPAGLPGKAAVDILCCDILDSQRLWVGFEDGDLYYSRDGGTTWAERVFPMPADAIAGTTLTVNDIMFVDDFCGYMAVQYQSAGAVTESAFYKTIDGGRNWIPYNPVSSPFETRAVWACDWQRAFFVGDAETTTTVHELAW